MWNFIRRHNVAVAYALAFGAVAVTAAPLFLYEQSIIDGFEMALWLLWAASLDVVVYNVAPVIRWAEDEDWEHYDG